MGVKVWVEQVPERPRGGSSAIKGSREKQVMGGHGVFSFFLWKGAISVCLLMRMLQERRKMDYAGDKGAGAGEPQ